MIITFYSYKGGVGRTMALANVAYIFARAGFEVVLVDWDLEAPGLERFFYEETSELQEQPGLLDLLLDYKALTSRSWEEINQESAPLLSTEPYMQTINYKGLPEGALSIMTAGRRGKYFTAYATEARAFNWDEFYKAWDGERFYEWLRDELEGPNQSRLVLIDSRTGVSEMNSPSTYQLADVVVMLSALNRQNLEGSLHMATSFFDPLLQRLRGESKLDMLVVPSRVDDSEANLQDELKQRFLTPFQKLETTFDHRYAWELAIPYVPKYAYDETIMVVDPKLPSPSGPQMLGAYHRLSLILAAFQSADTYRQLLTSIQSHEVGFTPGGLFTQPLIIVQSYLMRLIEKIDELSLADTVIWQQSLSTIRIRAVYTEQLARYGVSGAVTHNLVQTRAARNPRQAEYPALFLLAQHQFLVLLGDPGIGKSTLVRFVALLLSQKQLEGLPSHEILKMWLTGVTDTLVSESEKRVISTRQTLLLPIHIPLQRLAAEIEKQGGQQTIAQDILWRWINTEYGEKINDSLVQVLHSEAEAGRVLWLFDGLDEVPANKDHEPLRSIVRLIRDLAKRYAQCRFVVTCRTASYGQNDRKIAGKLWEVATLQPFVYHQQHLFIKSWIRELIKASDRANENPSLFHSVDPQILSQELISKLISSRSSALAHLARSPLLLAMITMLYYYERNLPDERVRLYERCLELLLYRWRPPLVETTLRDTLDLTQWTSTDTNRLLDRLGYAVQTRWEYQSDEGNSISRKDVLAIVSNYFMVFDPAMSHQSALQRAGQFCDYLSTGSNAVLIEDQPNSYRFLHRTFQEYLAARRLVADDDWDEPNDDFIIRLLKCADDDERWHEVLLMAIGSLAANGQIRLAFNFVAHLLTRHKPFSHNWQRHVNLAGETLLELGHGRVFRLSSGSAIWQDVVAALTQVLTSPTAHGRERVRAGELLGLLEDTRPGVTTLEPDWCSIPEGPFLLGNNIDPTDLSTFEGTYHDQTLLFAFETPQRMVTLPAFSIARYPVTNAQWRLFLESADGYDTSDWWSEEGWRWKQEVSDRTPPLWREQGYNGLNQPVVGVCWYEANAFCRWMSKQLGYPVYLPSEAQWEKAARGTDGRLYPWGDAWDQDRANTKEAELEQPVTVGTFPLGNSPYDVVDMAGQIFEWTASDWSRYQQHHGAGRVEELDSAGKIFTDRTRIISGYVDASDVGIEPTDIGSVLVSDTLKHHCLYLDPNGIGSQEMMPSDITVRGGSWNVTLEFARCAARQKYPPDQRDSDLGFRLATDYRPVQKA